MKTEYACGRKFEVEESGDRPMTLRECMEAEEPGDQPATTDPYLQLFFTQDALALVDLLHEKDRDIEEFGTIIKRLEDENLEKDMEISILNSDIQSWRRMAEKAVTDYEKRNMDYWELKKFGGNIRGRYQE